MLHHGKMLKQYMQKIQHSAPKLTEKHTRPNNFNMMKVKALRHTVAAAIFPYVSVVALSPAKGTAEFIEKFGLFFYCVNSSTLHSTKCALSNQTKY